MLTIGDIIAVIGLCVSVFMLGYRIGRDRKTDETEHKQK